MFTNISKDTYTNTQDIKGIYIMLCASNSVYKGFNSLIQARQYKNTFLNNKWKIFQRK
jgi:hypothetical protein